LLNDRFFENLFIEQQFCNHLILVDQIIYVQILFLLLNFNFGNSMSLPKFYKILVNYLTDKCFTTNHLKCPSMTMLSSHLTNRLIHSQIKCQCFLNNPYTILKKILSPSSKQIIVIKISSSLLNRQIDNRMLTTLRNHLTLRIFHLSDINLTNKFQLTYQQNITNPSIRVFRQ
jgi:hypothetical protein